MWKCMFLCDAVPLPNGKVGTPLQEVWSSISMGVLWAFWRFKRQ